ncbi:MAG: hypothetical protein ACFFE8_11605 [Candidatus Heimdallarchaeota archaeon]
MVIHPCSVFVILPFNVIELCFSRDERIEQYADRADVSQFLILAAIDYIKRFGRIRDDWKKWLFFVLQFAFGENFRLDSFRDYPRIEFAQISLLKILINQYDLLIDPFSKKIDLRVTYEKLERFLKVDSPEASLLTSHVENVYDPLDQILFSSSIRVLDLRMIPKRFYLVTPEKEAVQAHLIQWKDLTPAEYRMSNHLARIPESENIVQLPPLLSEEELHDRNWNDHRQVDLEQPHGLYCPKCYLVYEANIYAKMCSSCFIRLTKA